jgi:MerR family transcriptional regulator, thiopeptide resistance regulator
VHAAEAEQRWGNTSAWHESRRRTAAYSKQDWITIKAEAEAEADANITGFADALRAGEPADCAVAMDLAEEHRQHLCRWFYDCDYDMHRGLAELYVCDPRYMASYDETEPGFSQYVRDAIMANADRHR